MAVVSIEALSFHWANNVSQPIGLNTGLATKNCEIKGKDEKWHWKESHEIALQQVLKIAKQECAFRQA